MQTKAEPSLWAFRRAAMVWRIFPSVILTCYIKTSLDNDEENCFGYCVHRVQCLKVDFHYTLIVSLNPLDPNFSLTFSKKTEYIFLSYVSTRISGPYGPFNPSPCGERRALLQHSWSPRSSLRTPRSSLKSPRSSFRSWRSSLPSVFPRSSLWSSQGLPFGHQGLPFIFIWNYLKL